MVGCCDICGCVLVRCSDGCVVVDCCDMCGCVVVDGGDFVVVFVVNRGGICGPIGKGA